MKDETLLNHIMKQFFIFIYQFLKYNPKHNGCIFIGSRCIAVCTCVQLPFNKNTSCLYNRYWSICKYKLNYAHHETAASIVIVFLMAKCERVVHKSFWVVCPVQRQHCTIPRCWLLIAQAHWAACLVSDLWSFFRFVLHRTFQTELWSYVI